MEGSMTAKRWLCGAAAVLLALALAACSNNAGDSGSSGGSSSGTRYNFVLVSHGNAGDKFWDVVKNGAEQAGKDLDVKVTYQGNGDPQQQSQLIDSAVSQKVDGLVVSMANPPALKDSIAKAVQAGIPVITINSGEDRSKEFGALTHVGQNEKIAGAAAGERFAGLGAKHLLCVIHEQGNIGLEDRCAGAKGTFKGQVENLQVNVSDLADASSKIAAKLQSDKSVDAILTLNNGVATAAVSAIQQANSQAKLATFDLDQDVTKAIEGGQIQFAIDQQPYLQGYLPVQFLYLYKSNGNVVGGGQTVLTGPGFVDKANAAQVAGFAAKGTR
jgi:simple sugar transport system substrate-binding protein